ncbi:MAG: MFS transporter [Pseudomonadales bacterium]|nr:MFS transporter [Pseudomonadales bacterium]NIX08312.1 MFS transporter [Pseudomonadales bacterium]
MLVRSLTPANTSGRIPAWRLGVFASIAFPSVGMTLPLSIFLPPFYTKTLGLGLAEVGFVFMLVRMFDIVTDPVMGIIGDRFDSRWGRRRHWLVIALPFMMIGVYMAFMPSGSPSIWYLGFWLVVLYAGTTMKTISHTAWAAELSPDYDQRSRIAGFNSFAAYMGSLLILGPLAYLEFRGTPPAGHEALTFFGTMALVFAPICVFAAVALVGERPTAPAPRIGLIRGLGMVLRNPHMRRLLLADAMAAIPGSVMSGLFIFYQAELLGNAQFNSLALIGFFVAHIIGVPLWVRLSFRVGKHRAFGISALCFCFTTSLFFFPGEGDVPMFVAFLFLTGLAHSGLQFLLRSMGADVVDYDNVQTGGQRTGLYFALLAITAKAGGALAIGITYPLLAVVGFDAQGGNPEEAKFAFRMIYLVVPVVAMILAYVFIRGFRLDEAEQRALQSQIERRDGLAGEEESGGAAVPDQADGPRSET